MVPSSLPASRVSWIAFLALGAGALAAQDVRKLSGDLPRPPTVEVSSLAISPDGARVVYEVEVPVNTQHYNLCSVPIGGGASEVLTPHVVSYRIAPSSERVLVLARPTAGSSSVNLHSVSIDDGALSAQLNAPLGTGGLVTTFDFDASGARAAFLLHNTSSAPTALAIAPVDGSAAALSLSGALPVAFFGDQRNWFGLGATRAVFLTPMAGNLRAVCSVPLDGSAAPTMIAAPWFSTAEDTYIRHDPELSVSPDGSRLVGFADPASAGVALYSVPLDGGSAPVQLSTTAPRAARGYLYMPGGGRVVYVADQDLCSVNIDGRRPPVVLDAAPQGWTTGEFAIDPSGEVLAFVRTAPGGARWLYGLRLAHGPTARQAVGVGIVSSRSNERYGLGLAGQAPKALSFSADGTWLVYESGTSLYGVPSDGSAAPVLLSGGHVLTTGSAQLSTDGARVVFRTYDASAVELYSSPLDGSSPPARVHPDLAPLGDVASLFAIDPTGEHVVYGADHLSGLLVELFASPIAGGAATQLSPEFAPGPAVGEVDWFEVAPDGQHALYVSPEDDPSWHELFSAPLPSAGAALKLNEPLLDGGQVLENSTYSGQHLHPVLTPDGSAVLYLVDGEHRQLFRSPADGAGPTLLLDGATAPYPNGQLVLTSAGERVVYRAEPGLRSLRVDGSTPPTTTLASGESAVREYRVTADGSRLVYLKGGAIGDELFSVPMDGSQVVTMLSPPLLFAGTDVKQWTLSPDGTRAVFLVPSSAGPSGTRYELYSAPTDGSAAAVKLNGTVVATGGALWSFEVSADSSRVAYASDQNALNKLELYSVPIDGSAPAVKLSHALPSGGDVSQLQVTAGGRVLYLATGTTSVARLYSVPLDGSAAAVHLSGTFGPGGGVVDFLQHSDGLTVVYRAEQLPHDDWQFYRVPIAGGSAPVLLNDVAHPSWNGTQTLPDATTRYQLSPDGAWVVYHAQRPASTHEDLFAATTDGSLVTIQLNPPTTLGTVLDYRVRADSAAVVYFAEQDAAGQRELYQTVLELPLVAEPGKVVVR